MVVVINESSSSDSHVLSLIPQGSILGPLLFLIYMGVNLFFTGARHLLLFRTIKEQEDFQLLQDDISRLEPWLDHQTGSLQSIDKWVATTEPLRSGGA